MSTAWPAAVSAGLSGCTASTGPDPAQGLGDRVCVAETSNEAGDQRCRRPIALRAARLPSPGRLRG
jgi:hypothetical protein